MVPPLHVVPSFTHSKQPRPGWMSRTSRLGLHFFLKKIALLQKVPKFKSWVMQYYRYVSNNNCNNTKSTCVLGGQLDSRVQRGTRNFNEDISAWDVRRAENLSFMSTFASSFNQPLGEWDICRAKNLGGMFANASSFNQPLGTWAVPARRGHAQHVRLRRRLRLGGERAVVHVIGVARDRGGTGGERGVRAASARRCVQSKLPRVQVTPKQVTLCSKQVVAAAAAAVIIIIIIMQALLHNALLRKGLRWPL